MTRTAQRLALSYTIGSTSEITPAVTMHWKKVKVLGYGKCFETRILLTSVKPLPATQKETTINGFA
ncbi:unnamed protein product [Bathycoccus prasinos]